MLKTLVKVMGTVLLVVCVAAGGAYLWLSRDRAPTHPVLAASDMTTLIPQRDFWANTDSEWDFTLSGKGQYIAWRAVDGTQTVIRVKRRDGTGGVQTIRPANSQSAGFTWANDDRYLRLTHYDNQRWSVWRIDAADVDAPWQEVTPRGFRDWRVTRPPVGSNPNYTLSSRDRSREYPDLYSVDPDGYGKEMIRRNDGEIFWWLVNSDGAPTLRSRRVAPGVFNVEYDADADNRDWVQLIKATARDAMFVHGEDKFGKVWINTNLDREHRALIRIDPLTGEQETVFERADRDVRWVEWFGRHGGGPDWLILGGGYPEYHALSPLGEQVLAALEGIEGPYNLNLLSATTDGALLTFAINIREDGWRYLLVDTRAGTREWLGDHPMTRYSDALADTTFERISARDGLDLPILVTRPKGVTGAAPMVALIHGGPMSQDDWGYDRYTQFLANRGYAVLRVNYRGSTGYGRTLQRAGDREYGRKMQDDIQDAVQWAIDQGIADAENVAIMGGSFGGYSAMMGVARDPDLYAAGVSFVGSLDLEYQTTNAPHFWGVDKTYWTQVIGDPDIAEDRAEMREYSPMNLTDTIKAPVFLAHGIQDRVVDRADTERFVAKLAKRDHPHEVHYYEREGHGFRRWQTQIKFFRALEEFLADHLGGRSGGFDYVEIGAWYID